MGGFGACRNALKYSETFGKAAVLSEAGAKVTYEEGEGIHDWYFWDTYIQRVLKWLNYSAERK